ncbi:tetratricopeptide repeat protein [Nocardioides sp. AE5]|uniref:tetratricopeptide repeat protein n=1 Tax=Nocardioides sp. AE5 TaxID=2962573 RepID=UPI002881E537|nr:tetratricopeptide repeat protein [Nocardioides sp. AE5]MDT0200323.1 tetratricopeptide repeat protein [Nocardioides sp. AE5]
MTDLDRAEHLLDLGRAAEAEQAARTVLASQPGHAAALHLIGRALHLQERNQEAEAALRSALAVDPDAAVVMISLSEVLFTLRRAAEATAVARRAVDLEPHWWVAHYQLARCLVAGNREERRSAHLVARESVRLAPHSADAHNLHGMALDEAGQRRKARAAYHRATELDPEHGPALNNLAVLDNSVWRVGRATRSLRQALAIDPSDPTFRANLGILVAQLAYRLLLVMAACGLVVGILILAGTAPVWRALVGTALLVLVTVVARSTWRTLPAGLRATPRSLLSQVGWRGSILVVALAPLGVLLCLMAFAPLEVARGAGAALVVVVRMLAIIGIVSLVVRGLTRSGGQGR